MLHIYTIMSSVLRFILLTSFDKILHFQCQEYNGYLELTKHLYNMALFIAVCLHLTFPDLGKYLGKYGVSDKLWAKLAKSISYRQEEGILAAQDTK